MIHLIATIFMDGIVAMCLGGIAIMLPYLLFVTLREMFLGY